MVIHLCFASATKKRAAKQAAKKRATQKRAAAQKPKKDFSKQHYHLMKAAAFALDAQAKNLVL